MRLRASTEPVWGTLLHFRRLKKVYAKGNDLANKQVLMAAANNHTNPHQIHKLTNNQIHISKKSVSLHFVKLK